MRRFLAVPLTAPAPQTRRQSVASAMAAGTAVVVFLVGVWAAWRFTIDDAYITWRYSQHLADGYGPVWNVGGDPVEGFTNFAWMAWHAGLAVLGLDLPTVAKITSMVVALATLAMLVRYAGGRAGAVVAAGAYLLFLPTYFHITSGLETAAFAAVLVRASVVGLRVLDYRPVRPWEPPLLLLLAGTLRPEGALAAAPAVAVWLWHHRRSREVWLWTAAGAVLGAGYFAWRCSFYGRVLPNTFYAKFGNIAAGQDWIEVTTAALLPLIVLTGSLVLLRSTSRVGVLLCATVTATYLPYAVSGPSMDYLHRFAFHAYPLMCLGAGLAVTQVAPRRLAAGLGASAVGWVALAGVTADDLPTVVNYSADLARTHVAIGQGLAAAPVPEHARTLAVSDAGAIPYYSGWRTTDYIGLNNEAITAGADVNAVVARAAPTVIVVTGRGQQAPPSAYGLRIAAAVADYEPVADVRTRENYSQHVYATPRWSDEVRTAVLDAVSQAQRKTDPGRYELTLDRWLDRLRARLPLPS